MCLYLRNNLIGFINVFYKMLASWNLQSINNIIVTIYIQINFSKMLSLFRITLFVVQISVPLLIHQFDMLNG